MRKGDGSGAGSGTVPLTNRSESGYARPKHMRILLIRIPNTATKTLRIKNQIYIALGPVCALFCTLSLSLPYSSLDGTAPPCNPAPPCSRSPGSSSSQASTNPSAGKESREPIRGGHRRKSTNDVFPFFYKGGGRTAIFLNEN